MAIIIDLILILIIALSTFIGYKQGLVKAAIKILSFVIAIVIALVLYKPVSNVIIKNTGIDDKINSTIIENAKLSENKSEGKSNVVKDSLSSSIIAGTNTAIEGVSNSFTVKVIEIAVMILLYVIARIILLFISKLSDVITNLPILKQLNKTGGIIYGFVKGIFLVCVILGVIYLVSPMMKTNTFGIIDETIITKTIYNNNILLTLIF